MNHSRSSRSQMGMPRIEPKDGGDQLRATIATILQEKRSAGYEGVRSLWRIGDAVAKLRMRAGAAAWRRVLRHCSEEVGLHPASLDDAARAARAFPRASRAGLLRRFEESGAPMTRGHIIALARATPARRAQGIEALLGEPQSVRRLRTTLSSLRPAGPTRPDLSAGMATDDRCKAHRVRRADPIDASDSVTVTESDAPGRRLVDRDGCPTHNTRVAVAERLRETDSDRQRERDNRVP
jgi:hypothetical protein